MSENTQKTVIENLVYLANFKEIVESIEKDNPNNYDLGYKIRGFLNKKKQKVNEQA